MSLLKNRINYGFNFMESLAVKLTQYQFGEHDYEWTSEYLKYHDVGNMQVYLVHICEGAAHKLYFCDSNVLYDLSQEIRVQKTNLDGLMRTALWVLILACEYELIHDNDIGRIIP